MICIYMYLMITFPQWWYTVPYFPQWWRTCAWWFLKWWYTYFSQWWYKSCKHVPDVFLCDDLPDLFPGDDIPYWPRFTRWLLCSQLAGPLGGHGCVSWPFESDLSQALQTLGPSTECSSGQHYRCVYQRYDEDSTVFAGACIKSMCYIGRCLCYDCRWLFYRHFVIFTGACLIGFCCIYRCFYRLVYIYRCQLWTSPDQCVHNAVVSDPVCHLSAKTHRTEGVGLHSSRGLGNIIEDSPGHLGKAH